jgi:hypothetical protein
MYPELLAHGKSAEANMTSITSGIRLATLAVATLGTSVSGHAQSCPSSPALSNGSEIVANEYEVLRNGKAIGQHTVRFESNHGIMTVTAETHMQVKILFFTAYRYHYKSQEFWCGNQLQAVRTRVNDGGDTHAVTAQRSQNGYVIDQNGTQSFVSGTIPPTNHWNIDLISSDRLFNTITGQLNNVQITHIDASNETIPMRKYSIRGELNIDTTYDQTGNWMGMTFDHDDGSAIEFRCVDCNNTPDQPS